MITRKFICVEFSRVEFSGNHNNSTELGQISQNHFRSKLQKVENAIGWKNWAVEMATVAIA